jgi:hypothetical protein
MFLLILYVTTMLSPSTSGSFKGFLGGHKEKPDLVPMLIVLQ